MPSDLKLDADTTTLLVIDVQERLATAMPEQARESAVQNVARLVRAAEILELPVVVSEQYPKGLGPTVPQVQEALAALSRPARVVEKLEFSACESSACARALVEAAGEPTSGEDVAGATPAIVVTGMEAHVCVYQTARDLVQCGYRVHVATDATCSRSPDNHRVAEQLWARAGAVVSSTETVLFDLLGVAQGDGFKAVSGLVR